ncbi:MAG: 16S rRNA (cytosine(1402)-N(4))-methyltransferase RsmH, partial [Bacteroidota bacterium]
VDVTFGGGGHTREILTRLDQGHLYAFDQDPDALQNIPDDERFTLIPENFRFLKRFLRLHGVKQVNGILADLGVSSHQFDEGARGFSIRFDAPLDMRMSQKGPLTAKTIVNEWEPSELTKILRRFGELNNAKKAANLIAIAREEEPINSTFDLLRTLQPITPSHKGHRFQAQVFQALRIVVNGEMEALEDFFEQSIEVLQPKGILSVITYHSLEDRMTKYFMRSGNASGDVEKDFFGRHMSPMKPLIKGNSPTEQEIAQNSRARSARLRTAMKL